MLKPTIIFISIIVLIILLVCGVNVFIAQKKEKLRLSGIYMYKIVNAKNDTLFLKLNPNRTFRLSENEKLIDNGKWTDYDTGDAEVIEIVSNSGERHQLQAGISCLILLNPQVILKGRNLPKEIVLSKNY